MKDHLKNLKYPKMLKMKRMLSKSKSFHTKSIVPVVHTVKDCESPKPYPLYIKIHQVIFFRGSWSTQVRCRVGSERQFTCSSCAAHAYLFAQAKPVMKCETSEV